MTVKIASTLGAPNVNGQLLDQNQCTISTPELWVCSVSVDDTSNYNMTVNGMQVGVSNDVPMQSGNIKVCPPSLVGNWIFVGFKNVCCPGGVTECCYEGQMPIPCK
jgi:hypothetical protein